jgi:imidazolonepropionase-like amidohydrolase
VRRVLPLLLALGALTAQAQTETYLLQDVRLIDGTGKPARDHVNILVTGGRIARLSSGAIKAPGSHVLKLSGKTVMPAIINGHGHLGLTQGVTTSPDNYTQANVERELDQYQRYGVTTMISLGMNKDLLYQFIQRQQEGTMDGAMALTADRGLGVPGSVPPVKVGADQVYRPATPEQARQDVREMASRHPSLIKMWVDTNLGKLPAPNPAVYGAAIDEAHNLHFRVAAHVFYLADAKRLLADHVDILAHSIRDVQIDPATVAAIKKQGVFYIPTLQLEESFYIYAEHPSWMDTPFFRDATNGQLWQQLNSPAYKQKVERDPTTPVHRKALQTASVNLKLLHDAGVKVSFGTDSGANPYRIAGFAEHRELQLMVAAGLTPMQAIQCATQEAARMLKIDDQTGTIETGKYADLLVLNDDPSTNILNTQKIALVFHRGKQVPHE